MTANVPILQLILSLLKNGVKFDSKSLAFGGGKILQKSRKPCQTRKSGAKQYIYYAINSAKMNRGDLWQSIIVNVLTVGE